jgi:hypothetical protein
MTEEEFLEECAFAKLVTDGTGWPCILVAGIVFKVDGVVGANYTEMMVSALRNCRPRKNKMTSTSAAVPSEA